MGVNEDFDSMLLEIGDCGLYQFKQYVLIGLAIAFSAASAIGFVFTAAIVPHRYVHFLHILILYTES
jgi:hypothetical protein